ncbi:MAG: RNA polymerase sigma factor [Armatimonadota bacterium]
MAASDDELMRRIQGGDAAALGDLFTRHQPAVFRFLCRFMGDATAAEDTTQEVFWRVWQYRSRFGGGALASWIYTIARHAALDDLRRRKQRGEERAEAGDELAGTGCEPERGLLEANLREQVRRALLELPEEQRLAVILREYEGRSHREIGEILGCSEGNARVIAHRARCALRRRLRPVLEEEDCRV